MHGEGEARLSLARALGHLDEDQIQMPGLGDELDLAPRIRRDRPPTRGIGKGAPLDEAAMSVMAEHVRARPRPVTPRDLAVLWAGGPEVAPEVVELAASLLQKTPDFTPDRKRPFLYRPTDPADLAKLQPPVGPMDMQRAFEVVDRWLGPQTGLYRRGLLPEEGALLLSFHFPDVAGTRHAEEIATIALETGYQVRLKPEPHMGELAARAIAVLPAMGSRAPSIRLETREVVLKAEGALDPAGAAEFQAQTGFCLVLEPMAPAVSAPAKFDAQGRREINAAFALLEERFRGLPHAPRKKSKRMDASGPYLELSFVSGSVAARYKDVCSELELESGWNIRLGSSPDQAAVLSAAKELIPSEWGLLKTPGLNLASEVVTVRLANRPDPEGLAAVAAELEARTGFRLELAPV